jgi:hypothetical protein
MRKRLLDPSRTHPRYYILDADHNPVAVRTVEEWAIRFEAGQLGKIVAVNTFGHAAIGTVKVSTVFLGLDHGFGTLDPEADQRPVLFETMIFAPENDVLDGHGLNGWMERCCTWDEALAMHQRGIEVVKNAFAELHKASGA